MYSVVEVMTLSFDLIIIMKIYILTFSNDVTKLGQYYLGLLFCHHHNHTWHAYVCMYLEKNQFHHLNCGISQQCNLF